MSSFRRPTKDEYFEDCSQFRKPDISAIQLAAIQGTSDEICENTTYEISENTDNNGDGQNEEEVIFETNAIYGMGVLQDEQNNDIEASVDKVELEDNEIYESWIVMLHVY